MAVKGNKSGLRVLAVLEEIARHQPVGGSQLARLLEAEKSAIQRAIRTLVDGHWIQAAPGSPTRWQLTGHIHMVAHLDRDRSELRKRARPALEALRDASGETICLNVPDVGRFVVVEVVESRHNLRVAFQIGDVAPVSDSASGRVIMPYLTPADRAALLGHPLDAEFEQEFVATREQGYYVLANRLGSGSIRVGGSINVAAPIFEVDGRPAGAIVLSAPRERLAPDDYERVGAMVRQTANALSLCQPATA